MVYFLTMKRLIDWHLNAWKSSPKRKPLLLRGARQIGKTYAVRQLGKSFESFVEINFELIPEAKRIFEKDLQPDRILLELSLLSQKALYWTKNKFMRCKRLSLNMQNTKVAA